MVAVGNQSYNRSSEGLNEVGSQEEIAGNGGQTQLMSGR